MVIKDVFCVIRVIGLETFVNRDFMENTAVFITFSTEFRHIR